MHHANPDFWECFRGLPTEVQDLARSAHALLKQDPRHPSLHFKKVGAYWSVRVDAIELWPSRRLMAWFGCGLAHILNTTNS